MAIPFLRPDEEDVSKTPESERSVTEALTKGLTARLRVVPRRRRAAGFVVTLSILVAAVFLVVALLHTRLAERQLNIDRIGQDVRQAESEFDVLRRERAELRSPIRLSTEAERLGLRPASDNQFRHIDPRTVAITIARTGLIPGGDEDVTALEPLDQFRLVKRVSADTP